MVTREIEDGDGLQNEPPFDMSASFIHVTRGNFVARNVNWGFHHKKPWKYVGSCFNMTKITIQMGTKRTMWHILEALTVSQLDPWPKNPSKGHG